MDFDLIHITDKHQIPDILMWLLDQGEKLELYCRDKLSSGSPFPWWDILYFDGEDWRLGDYDDEDEYYWEDFISIHSDKLKFKRKKIGGI